MVLNSDMAGVGGQPGALPRTPGYLGPKDAGLSVQDVTVARGAVPVLAGVSFTVPPGSALILRGPNGVGKTTLLRALAGLQPVLAGRVSGADEAAYASHADGVKSALTVAENLSFWAALYGGTVDSGLWRAFALDGLQDRPAGSLSAGQRRRAGLARLAVTGRRLLLLDEPTVSLDAASVTGFARWLQDSHLARGGIAVLATHIDLGLAAPALDLTPFRARARIAADETFL